MVKKKKRKNHLSGADYRAMRELQDEGVLAELGGTPIYYHSKIQNAKVGLAVAEKAALRTLSTVREQAVSELHNQLAVLDKKYQDLEQQIKPLTIKQFLDTMTSVTLSNGASLDQIASKFLELKSATSGYGQVVSARSKVKAAGTEHVSLGPLENLTLNEALDLQNHLRTDVLTNAMLDVMQTAKGLDEKIDKELKRWLDEYFTQDGTRIKAGASMNKIHRDLGVFFELLCQNQQGIQVGPFSVKFENVSAAFHMGEKEEKYNKTDTLISFYVQGSNIPFFTMSTSDKTGGASYFQSVQRTANG